MKNSGIKRIVSAILIISLGGSVMLGLSGCFGKKYKVDYCGQKGSFEGAKDSYRAGERVELRFSHIATDTDYYFYVDGQRVNPGYDSDRHCYVISFTMPEQGVTVKYSSKNTMLYEPETEGKMLIDYYTATVGTNGGDCHYELVLSTYRDGMEKLEVFEGDDFEGGKKETCTAYIVPRWIASLTAAMCGAAFISAVNTPRCTVQHRPPADDACARRQCRPQPRHDSTGYHPQRHPYRKLLLLHRRQAHRGHPA